MTSTHETPMSLFSHNKCGKIAIEHWELDLFFYFTFYLFRGGGAYAPNAPPCLLACLACTVHSLYAGWVVDHGGLWTTSLIDYLANITGQFNIVQSGPARPHHTSHAHRGPNKLQPRGCMAGSHRLVVVVRAVLDSAIYPRSTTAEL